MRENKEQPQEKAAVPQTKSRFRQHVGGVLTGAAECLFTAEWGFRGQSRKIFYL